MKSFLLQVGLILVCSYSSYAQQLVQLEGHGSHQPDNGICVTPEHRANIEAEIQTSREALIRQGLLSNSRQGGSVLMNFPLAMAPGSDWNTAYAISGYVDQEAGSGILSHNCDNRTYNGHMGTDYYSWPFGGYQMENDLLQIIAAAPGVIVYKNDGQYDQQCDLNSNLIWNAVYVEHSDGTIAWYGHMKEGSLTTKGIGESVEVGEYLGVVGSSGFSSGPHLHFELHNANGTLIDPYFGGCNETDFASSWVQQPPYWEMQLNTLLTHDAVPEFGCPSANEEPNIEEYFSSFETVYLASYFKEQINGAQVDYRVRLPNGVLFAEWQQDMDADYESSYWYWTIQIPVGEVDGTWTFEADYEGETFIREFYVNEQPSGLFDEALDPLKVFPNPAEEFLSVGLPVNAVLDQLSHLELIDIQGRIVQRVAVDLTRQNDLRIDISDKAPGAYLLRMTSDQQTFYGQFLKE